MNTACISISVFAPLFGIPIGLKICAITAEIRKYKSMIEKNKKNMIK